MFKKLVLVLSLSFCHAFPTNDLSEDADARISQRAMENPDLFEGDIVLDSKLRFGVSNNYYRWPNKTIHYEITRDISISQRRTIEAAMEHISEKTCIRFKRWSNEENYIRIISADGCYSYAGMRRWGGQDLSLGFGCESFATAVHELMHAIGFWHQHSRSDRDEYLNIYWENIRQNAHRQFRKRSSKESLIFAPFDFDSIMLYGPFAFSKDGSVTMSSKKRGVLLRNPSAKKKLSSHDVLSINKLYDCI